MEIRKCKKEEVYKLMEFIDNHWKKNHILAKNLEVMDWQHYNKKEENYNYLLAIDNNEIVGCLGYIPNNHFNYNKEKSALWLALWKTLDRKEYSGIGIKMISKLIDIENTEKILVLGINEKVEILYKALGFKTGELEHFYMLNKNYNEFIICKIHEINFIEPINCIDKKIKEIINLDEIKVYLNENEVYMNKDYDYYINKYYNNPYYKYKIYGIYIKDKLIAFFVIKIIDIQNNTVLRIIDYNGEDEALVGLYKEFQNILNENKAEYIDFMFYGLNIECLYKTGFLNLEDTEDNIIPNYFEPFELKNITLRYAFYGVEDIQIFKGDGDQERPNIL